MTMKNLISFATVGRTSQRQGAFGPTVVVHQETFPGALCNCVQAIDRLSPRVGISSLPAAGDQKASGYAVLARVWAWLHTKYTISTTKRLRVSETISLGEKRFVAIVAVEGREFLIGGGTAGMSLLAPLGTADADGRHETAYMQSSGGVQ